MPLSSAEAIKSYNQGNQKVLCKVALVTRLMRYNLKEKHVTSRQSSLKKPFSISGKWSWTKKDRKLLRREKSSHHARYSMREWIKPDMIGRSCLTRQELCKTRKIESWDWVLTPSAKESHQAPPPCVSLCQAWNRLKVQPPYALGKMASSGTYLTGIQKAKKPWLNTKTEAV